MVWTSWYCMDQLVWYGPVWYGMVWYMVCRGGKGGRRPAQTNLPRTQVIPRPSSPLVNIIFVIVISICHLITSIAIKV